MPKHILQSDEGEVLKLGPPSPGHLIIKVDPQKSSSPFAMGTQTLLPGGGIPLHRHLQQAEVLFIHKGQGRATLDGQSIPVVPGTVVFVPQQAWHSLRNTGTGLLQMTWTVAPPGIEQFFRELSRLGGGADAAAIQALAARHGIEFRPETEVSGEAPVLGHRHRRRRRGLRGRAHGTAQLQPSPSQPIQQVAAPAAVQSQPSPAAQQQSSGGQRRHRRRHRRARRGLAPPPASQGATPQQPRPQQTPPAVRPKQGAHRQRRGHVKEVYMGGRWVQVEGEGPVIAPGRERPMRGRKRGAGDEDSPAGPLSVPL